MFFSGVVELRSKREKKQKVDGFKKRKRRL